MIVVRISHGLGNQMYQYALLLSLKKIYKDIDIKIDTNHYEKDKSHTGYILDKVFGIKELRGVRRGMQESIFGMQIL